MDTPKRVGVVMAGGSGERFWPLSTGHTPKQLLKLTHAEKNMLEEAVERLEGVVSEVFVSTTTKLLKPITNQKTVPEANILAEPAKRNTLGALVWVVAELESKGLSNASVAVVTADHYIGEVEKYRESVAAALKVAEQEGCFVTFGVQPTRPETGYGYIEFSETAAIDVDGVTAKPAVGFREKPDLETALEYLGSGKFLWNSGMFFFTVETFNKELAQTQPAAAHELEKIVVALREGDLELAKFHFERLPNLSIDYAVMEKVQKLFVVPVSFPWDDVGAWDALERAGDLTEHRNVVRGQPILVDVTDSVIVQNHSGIHVSVLGVTDLIVVSTDGAVLVCHKSQAQRVRELARLVAERMETTL